MMDNYFGGMGVGMWISGLLFILLLIVLIIFLVKKIKK